MGLKELRSATLGRDPQFKTELVELEINGQKHQFQIKEPSVAARAVTLSKAFRKGDGDERQMDSGLLAVYGVIGCVHDPESGDPVYTEEDVPGLLAQPDTSGWFAELVEAVNRVSKASESVAKN